MPKTINDYPPMIDLTLAVDLAVSLFPDLYPDPDKVRNVIRTKAKEGRIPGVKQIKLSGRERFVWQYDRDKLIKYLADPAAHKAGRPRKHNDRLIKALSEARAGQGKQFTNTADLFAYLREEVPPETAEALAEFDSGVSYPFTTVQAMLDEPDEGMKISDFKIGLEFIMGGHRWRCTDVGTRTAAAIKLDQTDERNYNGPPYSIDESVIDEYDMDDCYFIGSDEAIEAQAWREELDEQSRLVQEGNYQTQEQIEKSLSDIELLTEARRKADQLDADPTKEIEWEETKRRLKINEDMAMNDENGEPTTSRRGDQTALP